MHEEVRRKEGGEGESLGTGREEKVSGTQRTTGDSGRMSTGLGRRRKWKKQGTEGTIREVEGQGSEKYSSEIQGQSGFQKPQKACEEAKD